MADGWSDQRQRTLINFLVYCPAGISFVKSVDASNFVKDAPTLLALFSEVIDWVGPSNVVHLVTDNAANYASAGRLVHEKYSNIYWSPCAAHCLNLILKDISSMEHVAKLASNASKVTVFVYNHIIFLAWLRRRSSWKEIVRPAVTRFATTFITLQNLHEHKNDLQALMTNRVYTDHKLSRSDKGKVVSSLILNNKFWDDCLIMVKIAGPLIRLLRLVDSDEKPSLGYVYEGMRRARKAIKHMFKKKKSLYAPYIKILDERWDKHLRKKLHVAAYFLNPAFIYEPNFCNKVEVMSGLLDILDSKGVCSDGKEAIKEIKLYRDRLGSFSRQITLTTSKTLQPDEWWKLYGHSAPILQKIAIRLLSQTSSSSGCERNWSLFDQKDPPIEFDLNELAETLYEQDVVLSLEQIKNQSHSKDNGRQDDIYDLTVENVEFSLLESFGTIGESNGSVAENNESAGIFFGGMDDGGTNNDFDYNSSFNLRDEDDDTQQP
ncbi:uncharacterized protein LOC126672894 [Mercurialis annua]|nr:uncharacterized protein LOC126672894 [Mercurialis annua]